MSRGWWPTKAEIVVDVDSGQLPDAGTLRGDLVAVIRPFDDEQQQLRIQAMVSLLAVVRSDHGLVEVTKHAGIGPWIQVTRLLVQRAVDRGEFPWPSDSTPWPR